MPCFGVFELWLFICKRLNFHIFKSFTFSVDVCLLIDFFSYGNKKKKNSVFFQNSFDPPTLLLSLCMWCEALLWLFRVQMKVCLLLQVAGKGNLLVVTDDDVGRMSIRMKADNSNLICNHMITRETQLK